MSPRNDNLKDELDTNPEGDDIKDEIAISIRVPLQQAHQRLFHKNNQFHKTTSQIPLKRQQAIDVPTGVLARSAQTMSAIWLSPNNSFESNTTNSPSFQKLRQQQWSKQHSSLNSSNHSNGDIKSHAATNRSRKDSLFDIKDTARRKFSIIPQVSF